MSKPSLVVSSFVYANQQTIVLKDPENSAKKFYKEVGFDPRKRKLDDFDDEVRELEKNQKKLREERAKLAKKKDRKQSLPDNSLTKQSTDGEDDGEEEWSDCDELELSRNISLLENSISHDTFTTTPAAPKTPKTPNTKVLSPSKKFMINGHPEVAKNSSSAITNDADLNKRQQLNAVQSRQILPRSSLCDISFRLLSPTTDDDNEEWSDCDELELSRNISILEQSINQKEETFSP